LYIFESRLTRSRESVRGQAGGQKTVRVWVRVWVWVRVRVCNLSMGREVLDGRLIEFAPKVTNRAREVLLLEGPHKITHSQTKSRFRRACAAPRRSYRERQRERERERARESRERERQTDRQTLHVSSCSSSSCMCPPPYLELPPPLQRVRKRLFALCAILYV